MYYYYIMHQVDTTLPLYLVSLHDIGIRALGRAMVTKSEGGGYVVCRGVRICDLFA